MRPIITCHAPGIPVPQGSLRSGGRGQLFYSNSDKLYAWRKTIQDAIGKVLPDDWEPIDTAVALALAFVFPRPKSRKGERHKDSVPDLDKLVRAVLDAGTKVLYTDDARVAHIETAKMWSDTIDSGLVLRAWAL